MNPRLQTPLKAALILLAAYGLLQVAGRMPFWFSSGPVCEVHVEKVAMSPGMRYEGRISLVQCDNDKAPTLELSMRDKTEPNKRDIVELGYPSTTDFDLTWLSENRMQLSYPATYQLENEPYELSGVKIIVVKKSPAGDPRGEGINAR